MKHLLTDISGIGEATAALMVEHGIDSVQKLQQGGVEKLMLVPGFGEKRATTVLAAANTLKGVEKEVNESPVLKVKDKKTAKKTEKKSAAKKSKSKTKETAAKKATSKKDDAVVKAATKKNKAAKKSLVKKESKKGSKAKKGKKKAGKKK